jgi:hypothetical protein
LKYFRTMSNSDVSVCIYRMHLFNFSIKDDVKAAREHPQAGTRTEAYILVRRKDYDEANDNSALIEKLN